MRFFVELSYRGEPFHGWQIQPGDISVQEVIEKALSTIARCHVPITGAGRTDAGVNARRMIAHFDYHTVPPPSMLKAFDSLCGRDIAIHSIRRVKDDAHARFDATSRTYRYFATTRKNPFARELAWKAPTTLDFEAMNEAARLIIGRREYMRPPRGPLAQRRRRRRLVLRNHRRPLPPQHGKSRSRHPRRCRTPQNASGRHP